jgi:hypothetical protein
MGAGWGRSQIIRLRGSLAIYKSINTLSVVTVGIYLNWDFVDKYWLSPSLELICRDE